MGHVGDIGGRGGGRGRGLGLGRGGDDTRVGNAPTGAGPRAGGGPEGALEGGGEGGGGEGGGGLGEGGDGGGGGGLNGGFVPGGGRGAGRTGERPAMRTGERPAMGTGERPAVRTGERPSLQDRTSPRTTTRPSAPAATFADAMTPAKKDGKTATATETLVMPKAETPQPPVTRGGKTQEMPAARGQTAAEPSTEGRDGRSVQDMDSPVGRGANGTRVVRMTDVQPRGRTEAPADGKDVRKGNPFGEEKTVIAKAPQKDGFGTTPTTNNRPALGTTQVKEPVLPMKEIIPAGLNRLPDQPAVAKRFASDLALLQQQVRPSSLPSTDRALRLWAFFTAYAQAAAGKESTPTGKELFDKALKENGFGELRDKKTGEDGLTLAQWVLESADSQEAKERAGDVEMAPPPEVLLSESLKEGAGKPGAARQEGTQAKEGSPKAESELAQEGARKPENAKGQDASRKPENAQPQDARRPDNAQASDAFRKPDSAQSQETPRRLEDASRADLAQSRDVKDSSFREGPDRPNVDRPEARAELGRNPVLEQRPLILPKNPELERRQDDESTTGSFEEAWKKLGGNLRLGSNMFWNVLHRFRNSPEDSALEKEKWNQLVFAAILAFVGLMLLVILVVSL